MRKKIFNIIEPSKNGSWLDAAYDILMLLAITVSIVPLMFMNNYPIFKYFEIVTVTLFILDYLMRWMTADYKLGKRGWSFVLYPFTPMAIIDLLSILPGLNVLGQGFKLFRITRVFKVLRLFKYMRYSNQIQLLGRVLKREQSVLLSVLIIAIFYIFLTAMVLFNVEPHINPNTGAETFHSFFDALYWATVTLTTVGYGDLTPVTEVGRFISMLSSLFGVAIIALPSGVITAAYMEELREMKKFKQDQKQADGI